MNPSIQLKKAIPLFLATLTCVVISPVAQAVTPPPDGGYPGQNTAEGHDALFSLTTGTNNTAIGFHGLFDNTTGIENTAIGSHALADNTTGIENTAVGSQALAENENGFENTAIGQRALHRNRNGIENTAIGFAALFYNTSGDFNTAIGESALAFNRTGNANTAVGELALVFNRAGSFNTADGTSALQHTTGSFNTALGFGAGFDVTVANNVIAIGASGADVSNSCFIGNIRDVQTANADAIPVVIDSIGQLGTQSSSRRFKNEIKAMDSASEAILALKPVTFHYKSDSTNTPQFGLIAEEVGKVDPDLVVRDEKGDITVRYEAVNVMLLNEFLKEHRKNEQQRKDFEAAIARMQKQIEALTAGLQKVSAQIEVSKPAPQTVLNNQQQPSR
jgi:hypothetical protein